MDGLEEAEATRAKGSGGEHSQGTGQNGGLIGEDVAEHVPGKDDVEGGGTPEDVHGEGVHQEMLQRHVGIVLRHTVHDAAPEAAGRQDVGLVHRGQPLSPDPSSPEGHVGDALHLLHPVEEGVVGLRPLSLLLPGAEVDPPCKLPDKEDVHVDQHLRAEGGQLRRLWKGPHGPQVGEEAEVSPQSQKGLFGPDLCAVEGRIPHGPQKRRVGTHQEIHRLPG